MTLHNSVFIILPLYCKNENLNIQGKDRVNNFVDPLLTMEYCDNTLSTYVRGLQWLSF